jgi:hypothetical protein
VGAVAGRDVMTPTVAGKRALRAETGALAVDMESHVAARVAARRGCRSRWCGSFPIAPKKRCRRRRKSA